MAIIINSFSLLGIHAYPIHIEVDTLYGQPSLSIVGLGDQAVKEARERLEAAIINTKYEFPKMKIVINLSPSDFKKRGSHFDLGMIAKRIPTILPSMTEEESLETTKIYSVAGLLKNKGRLITSRPFRAPHHNASMNSLIGGGTYAMPGEISLAHNGILFLDEIAEFNKRTLDALRQPIEDGHVTISRVQYSHSFPSQFMLIAAMNPCPCGYYGEARCQCTDYEIKKYRSRLSGPIMDRIDIQKTFRTLDINNI
ncbi:MAG: ATP-binding protein [Cellulosilyticaceae bacterium]